MEQVDLIIRYKRDQMEDKTPACTGSMFYRHPDEAAPPTGLWEFEKTHFNKLLGEASRRLNNPDIDIQKIIIERIDRQGLRPVVLDNPTQEVLKTDPVVAIRLLNYEGNLMRSEGKGRTAPPPIRSGYDTLSESIGEEIFCRQHKGMVECPGCGMWSTANGPFTCKKKCQISQVPVTFTETWAKFKVTDLLQLNLDKYFIPREFNPTKPWITWEALNNLYLMWCQVANQQEKPS